MVTILNSMATKVTSSSRLSSTHSLTAALLSVLSLLLWSVFLLITVTFFKDLLYSNRFKQFSSFVKENDYESGNKVLRKIAEPSLISFVNTYLDETSISSNVHFSENVLKIIDLLNGNNFEGASSLFNSLKTETAFLDKIQRNEAIITNIDQNLLLLKSLNSLILEHKEKLSAFESEIKSQRISYRLVVHDFLEMLGISDNGSEDTLLFYEKGLLADLPFYEAIPDNISSAKELKLILEGLHATIKITSKEEFDRDIQNFQLISRKIRDNHIQSTNNTRLYTNLIKTDSQSIQNIVLSTKGLLDSFLVDQYHSKFSQYFH
jgi:hypothetical protein